MKIDSLVIENFKRVVKVVIKPGSNLVRIVGRNAQGKSSILDSLMAVFRGVKYAPSKAIHKGADKAIIKVECGDIVVTRVFNKGDTEETTGLTVESGKNSVFRSPQSMLNALFGSLSFDPLAFSRMDAKSQYAELQKFVPGVDFGAIAKGRKTSYERRTEVNRFAGDAESSAKLIVVPEGLPAEPHDLDAMTQELAAAGAYNIELEKRRANRAAAAKELGDRMAAIALLPETIDKRIDEILGAANKETERMDSDIQRLLKAIAARNEEAQKSIDGYMISIKAEETTMKAAAEDLRVKIESAAPLGEAKSLSAVHIEAARQVNADIGKRMQRAEFERLAARYKLESEALTKAIEFADKEKSDAIAAAKMPIVGLGFGDEEILYNDLPFEQASDAERLRVSTAIAMSQNPELRVLRIKEGSLLDDDGLKLLDEMCIANDFQCWVEIVSNDDPLGWVIEDGSVKSEPVANGQG